MSETCKIALTVLSVGRSILPCTHTHTHALLLRRSSQGAHVVECACMIELKALNGVGKLHERHPDVPVWSLISEDILTVKGEADA